MDLKPRERPGILDFLRTYFVRMVLGAALAAMVYSAISIWVLRQAYFREREFLARCESRGGRCTYGFHGPRWVPQSIEGWLEYYYRIDYVVAGPHSLPPEFFTELRSLTAPLSLDLSETDVTDADLEQLQKLANLRSIGLNRTSITDSGLVHLKSLTQLKSIGLVLTRTTPEGRASLRVVLPGCQIAPD